MMNHTSFPLNWTNDIPEESISSKGSANEIMKIALVINKYYLWFVLGFGFPGNLATIVTISRMRHLGSFALYVGTLAVLDNFAIMVKITILQLLAHRVNIQTAGCRLTIFFGNFLATYANWILVLMAVERLIAVRYPFRMQKYLCLKRTAVTIGVVGVVIAGAYAPIIWLTFYNEDTRGCDLVDTGPGFRSAIHWVNVSLFVFIPFLSLVLCNLLITREIRHSMRMRKALRSIALFTLNRGGWDISVQRQITLMLFTTTLVFVLLMFPNCAYNIADSHWRVQFGTSAYAVKYLCSQLAYCLCDATHAVNFYLYFLSARKFRNHFSRLTPCKGTVEHSIRLARTNQLSSKRVPSPLYSQINTH